LGEFGDVKLNDDATVIDTGLDDDALWGTFGWQLNDRSSLRLRYNRYRAEETGFGFVDPADYAPQEDRVRIYYPYQDFDRASAYYSASALGWSVADTLEAKVYWQSNQRQLANDIVKTPLRAVLRGRVDTWAH
jgi:hypothetical protein